MISKVGIDERRELWLAKIILVADTTTLATALDAKQRKALR